MKDTIRTWLTEQFGPDEALLDELYGEYANDLKAAADTLDALLAAGDLAALGEKAHAMKGMALQVGDAELAEPCRALQDASRAGNKTAATDLVPKVVSLARNL